ncbi:3-oxoacyl-ACP synthase III [Desulfobacula toluolica]|uniref:Putative 3-oxoacyl-[acyl-carrier-protein] synthase 3 n=1 Tax=Desulfobacula toluolica (strain DSM 7467 / Tol2) TaxID=651182 RepID=K0NPB5_DESTT|nr:3-oxoacyl-ACP synthase III [Desulfobacula toluolica]CCK80652.1 putative 3-oxoacyl-[acyl-carrier-protein] synthase 3 [Desulfobacula toluolica Tol2]
MKYSKVYISSIEYELAPNIITSIDIEEQLKPFYDAMGFNVGQLEALTGIKERRLWDKEQTLAQASSKAGQKTIDESGISPEDIEALVFCGVCKDGFEPATSCAIADKLKISKNAQIYDVSNACLGVITGIVQVANQIELGQIKAGLIVSAETSRQIIESTIKEINKKKDLQFYKETVATMTGGSGAVAVLLTDGSFDNAGLRQHAIKGGIVKNAIEHHNLCYWGFSQKDMPTDAKIIMRTIGDAVLDHGLKLAVETFKAFNDKLKISPHDIDKVIGHQITSYHHQAFYKALNIDRTKDFATYPYLGNIGTVSLPITAAIADERGFLKEGDFVAFIGIGSGINCFILGVEW